MDNEALEKQKYGKTSLKKVQIMKFTLKLNSKLEVEFTLFIFSALICFPVTLITPSKLSLKLCVLLHASLIVKEVL